MTTRSASTASWCSTTTLALAEGDGRVLPAARVPGSTRRAEAPEGRVEEWIAAPGDSLRRLRQLPLGRGDVLRRVAEALAALGMPAAITPADLSGRARPLPDGWLVRDYLPRCGCCGQARLAVTHGGNNSVTEAIGQGVPLLVLPFSTDQFAGAAAIERTGLGRALDPNAATVAELAARCRRARHSRRSRAARGDRARSGRRPGPAIAYDLLNAGGPRRAEPSRPRRRPRRGSAP